MTAAARALARPALLAVAPFAIAAAAMPDPIAAYPRWLALLGVATAGWLLAWARVARADRAVAGRGALVVVLAVGVALRALALVPPAPLSDDLYRYLWDGRVANAGIDPFRWAPDDEALAPFRDDSIWPRINHPEIPTIYPPIAQLAFRALDATWPRPAGVRAAMALADLLGVLALAALLHRRGRPPALAVVWAWCPLAVAESAGGGHVDALGAALLAAGLLALAARREAPAGLGVGLSLLVKPVAAFALPALLASRPGARARWALAGGVAVALLLVVPYLAAGPRLFAGFLAYADRWSFHDVAYGPLVAMGSSPRLARAVLASALVAVSLAVAVRRRPRDPLSATGVVVAALLVLSPTVHPWYALWLVPLLPFLPRPLRPAGVALVALLPVAYAAAWTRVAEGAWREPSWARWVAWGPVLLLLAAGWITRRAPSPGEVGPDRATPPGGSSPGSSATP